MSYKNHGVNNYPSHLLSNDEKGRDWILQYCKAAWHEYNGINAQSFYQARWKHHRTKEYAMGNQPINKYKPVLGVTSDDNESWLNIDWSVLPIIPKFRRIALNKLSKSSYNIMATPIDGLARNDKDSYFKTLKQRLYLREGLAKEDPSLPNLFGLERRPDEPQDLEELEMQARYTYKHQASIEMEQAIDLVLYQNDWDEVRRRILEDLFDDGVGIIKEYIDSNNAVRVRRVNPAQVIISTCVKNDFSDKQHVGEVLELTISDIKAMAGNQLSETAYEEIASKSRGLSGQGTSAMPINTPYSRSYDDNKIQVMDIEFYSTNTMKHEQRTDRRGNVVYTKVGDDYKERSKNNYDKTEYKVVYCAKWVIGTNHLFDFGLATDMKREAGRLMETEMSYHLYAPDFHNMRCLGIMEQLIPIADNIQIAYYRLQQAIAEARPKGIMIEMGALEDIPLGANGNQLTPMEVIDLFNKKGVLVYRKVDIQGRPTNYRPIEELQNGIGSDVSSYFSIIQQNIQMIRDITGLNEFTDGSTPDARALTTTAKLAAESTNNSLNNIHDGERNLLEKLCRSIVLRIQDVIQKGGKIEGYLQALGSGSMEFFSTSGDLSNYEFGMRLEDKPDDESRARLLAFMQANLQQGLIEMEDAILIESTDNLKVAQQILAYKIRRRKEEIESKAIRQQQMNAQVQQQSAMAAEQAKQKTIQLEVQSKAQLEQVKGEIDAKLAEQKFQYDMKLKEFELSAKYSAEGVKQGVQMGREDVMQQQMAEASQEGAQPQAPQPTPQNAQDANMLQ
jgi:hypothetical protein